MKKITYIVLFIIGSCSNNKRVNDTSKVISDKIENIKSEYCFNNCGCIQSNNSIDIIIKHENKIMHLYGDKKSFNEIIGQNKFINPYKFNVNASVIELNGIKHNSNCSSISYILDTLDTFQVNNLMLRITSKTEIRVCDKYVFSVKCLIQSKKTKIQECFNIQNDTILIGESGL